MSLLAALAPLRADAHRNLMKVVWVLASSASFDSGVIAWPGWDFIAARTGLSRRTVARWLAWLREYGVLAVLSPGTTADQRPGLVDDGLGELRAEYLLCVPALPSDRSTDDTTELQVIEDGEESGTPTRVSVGNEGRGGGAPDARARKLTSTPRRPVPSLPSYGRDESGRAKPWPMTRPPSGRTEMLAACQRLRAESVTLRALSARWLRAELRPAFQAGATPRDVLYALDHHPDGTPWRHTDQVRRVAGWIRYRLAAWRTDTGAWYAWPSQRAAQTREAARTAQRADRAREKAARAAAADPDHIRTLAAQRRTRLLEERAQRRHVDEYRAAAGPVTDSGGELVDFEAHRQAQIIALQTWLQQAGSG